MKKDLKLFISWSFVVFWMGLIFFFSAQPAKESAELSRGVTEVVTEFIEKVVPFTILDFNTLHTFIRKGAHLFIYFVLGILVFNAFQVTGIKGWKGIWWSLGVCVLYAITDEIHQLFVPGRSGEMMDVLIDSVGATGGIAFYKGFLSLFRIKL
ncbi:VanZ family protein [Proteinivorax tanatarense]|uniref:VanZ family protein n=1 Tax=Proteinivorax tanatarense TaxID=1260629 RepID=A0AAU7VHR6_9FIRM